MSDFNYVLLILLSRVAIKNLPPDLDTMVFKLSGGNPFWVTEITIFLTTYGAAEFISNIQSKNSKYRTSSVHEIKEKSTRLAQNRKTIGSSILPILVGTVRLLNPFADSNPESSPAPSNRRVSSNTSLRQTSVHTSPGPKSRTASPIPGSLGSIRQAIIGTIGSITPVSSHSFGSRHSSIFKMEEVSIKSQNKSNPSQVSDEPAYAMKGESKLSLLVICRFAKLSIDEQSVGRTASIIGSNFTLEVLNHLIPQKMRPFLSTVLRSLVEGHWLTRSSDTSPMGAVIEEYSFIHPLVQDTLYDLTPASVRSEIHHACAKYMEHLHFEDTRYFMALGHRKILSI
jgi:hypothetical protein